MPQTFHRAGHFLSRAAFAIAVGLIGAGGVEAADNATERRAEAGRLVAEAARAGLDGSPETRRELLARAIQTAPDHAPIRWAAGQVRDQDGWLPVREAQSAADGSPKLGEYAERRAAIDASGDPNSHARLARWCERVGLHDEARHHWRRVLDARPNHREALSELGLVAKDGRIATPDEFRSEALLQRDAQRGDRRWSRKVARWEKTRRPARGEEDPTLDEVRAITDTHAVPAFERLAATLADAASPRRERRLDLATAFVEALDALPGAEATGALVRFAVLAPHDGLRERATEALATRPPRESVPLLLAGLRSKAEGSYDVRVAQNGDVAYRHEVVTEGRKADFEYRKTRVGRIVETRETPVRVARDTVVDVDRMLRSTWQRRMASAQWLLEYQAQANELETRVAQLNQSADAINARIFPALEAATGQRLEREPRAWWDYWTQHEGYHQYDDRPTHTEYDQSEESRRVVSFERPRPRCECFVAGTPVWTRTGRAAIEAIREGDFVLAKNPETGELAFRAVLATTVREPSPMLTIDIGGERIVSTVGHPFWVVGKGWRMAKELTAGDALDTVDGPTRIASVEPAEDARAFNLVVGETASYFVGERGVLAHDNTDREPKAARFVLGR